MRAVALFIMRAFAIVMGAAAVAVIAANSYIVWHHGPKGLAAGTALMLTATSIRVVHQLWPRPRPKTGPGVE